MAPAQLVVILVGLFTAAGGVFNWHWFMGHWKSRLFVQLFGRQGARVFYIVFGLAIAALGAFVLTW